MPRSCSSVTYFVNWMSGHQAAFKRGSPLPNCPFKKFPMPNTLHTAMQAPSPRAHIHMRVPPHGGSQECADRRALLGPRTPVPWDRALAAPIGSYLGLIEHQSSCLLGAPCSKGSRFCLIFRDSKDSSLGGAQEISHPWLYPSSSPNRLDPHLRDPKEV